MPRIYMYKPGIVGADGAPGADGEDGYTPIKGVDYDDGADGPAGPSYVLWGLNSIGNYSYVPQMGNVSGTTSARPSAGRLYAYPYALNRVESYDRLSIYCQTAGTADARLHLGIYNDGGNGYPTTLALDGGELSGLDSAGLKELTIDQQLPAGLYWMALLHNSASTNASLRKYGYGVGPPFMPLTAALIGMGASRTGWYHSQAYGALPVTYPSDSPGMADDTFMICIRRSA